MTLVALMVPSPIMVVPTYLMKDWNGAVYLIVGASLFIISQSFVFWRRFVGAKWKQMSVTAASAGLARRAGRKCASTAFSAGLGFLPGICARAIRFA